MFLKKIISQESKILLPVWVYINNFSNIIEQNWQAVVEIPVTRKLWCPSAIGYPVGVRQCWCSVLGKYSFMIFTTIYLFLYRHFLVKVHFLFIAYQKSINLINLVYRKTLYVETHLKRFLDFLCLVMFSFLNLFIFSIISKWDI